MTFVFDRFCAFANAFNLASASSLNRRVKAEFLSSFFMVLWCLFGIFMVSQRYAEAMKNNQKTHCVRGHALSGDNLRIDKRGRRNCITCKRGYGTGKTIALTAEQRFWASVNKEPGQGPAGECWGWSGGRSGSGYGSFGLGKSSMGAHKFSYELHNLPVPIGLVVRHSCDNRLCVNPAHLSVGTYKDNTRDMAERGRAHNANKTHCKRGHELSGANLIVYTSARACKTCANMMQNKRKAASKALNTVLQA
jgi:hypothetical protein